MQKKMGELIDHRNEKLWNDLNQVFNIVLEESINNEYSCYSENKDITFFIVKENPCKSSFTHEMLHVYLRMKECFIGAGLKHTIWQSKILTSILSENLLEHIGNSLDHIKILPIYLRMGFEREKFIIDYDTNKCTPFELASLKQNYRIGKKVNPEAVDLLIGKFFAIMADPNNSIDYSKQLTSLQKIDPLLFDINQRMVSLWQKVDIEVDNVDYNSVLNEYYKDFKGWLSKNKLAY